MFDFEKFHYGYKPYHFLTPPKEDEMYGMQWPEGTNQFVRELHAYKVGGLGGKRKFDHLVNAIRLKWPDGEDGRPKTAHCIDFCKMGVINTSVLRVLWAWCQWADLGVAGCASSGKTRPLAACVIVDWECAPHETLTFICTTSLGASEDRIYGAIVQLWKSATTRFGTLLDYRKMIVFGGVDEKSAAEREYNNAIKAVAIEAGLEGQKAVDTMRGRKNARVRLVIDELPEMGSYVINARVNLRSNPDFRFCGIGNPARPDDAHGELCRPDHPDGFKSVNKNIPEWKTRTGHCIFLSGEWSPNFLVNESEPVPYPYLTSRDSLAGMLELCYGNAESLEYMRNAVGFWSMTTMDQTVLTRTLLEAYESDKEVEWAQPERKIIAGLDVAFTIGGDKCVAHFAELGEEWSGRKVLQPFATREYQATEGEVFEVSIARQVVDDCIKYNCEPDGLGMDISNDGGKIAKEIIRYWSSDPELAKKGLTNSKAYMLFAVSSQGTPTERVVSDIEPVPCSDRYDRRVTEYWMAVRQGVLCKVIRGMDLKSKYVTHLCARIYEARRTKLRIETKGEMKLRLPGFGSPDDGDAFCYLVEMARQHGMEFITEEAYRRKVDEAIQKAMQKKAPPRFQGGVSTGASSKIGTYGSNDWGEKPLSR